MQKTAVRFRNIQEVSFDFDRNIEYSHYLYMRELFVNNNFSVKVNQPFLIEIFFLIKFRHFKVLSTLIPLLELRFHLFQKAIHMKIRDCIKYLKFLKLRQMNRSYSNVDNLFITQYNYF